MEPLEMYDACTAALGDFVRGAGFSDVVIGLSGGMDSSLVAAMAVDALGAASVHGVLLPGPYSSESSIDDAEALAANLGIEARTISICEPFEAFESVLARACGGELSGLAAENTQARCRMVCLMALSNTHGWLMLNTGNKSEACMGYSTLYGDAAGAFAPLGGVYKTDVFAMARARNRRGAEAGERGPIPVNVFVKPPSAELSPDQEDEKSLGVDYATLDRILVAAVEEGATSEAIVESLVTEGRDGGQMRDLVDRVLARTAANAFKRALEPPYPAVDFYG
ncbi:NAD(+) synthase [Enterorhabdus mucosicola]|uniref:NH(3)-dependent NAD(+) synthetase n=1 Tax=Adlercreutzia mucosicola TaxID=580026 RepID=A0A6N8JKP8_9ACTN|nr:NAD(+) synthase [Adlercreutzia mucosicola]MVX60438.1 NAD(+) synthase [Adlercreutzia mucosicola]